MITCLKVSRILNYLDLSAVYRESMHEEPENKVYF